MAELITNNLVLDLDFTKGTTKDYSGNGNDGTLTNGEGFVKRGAGYSYLPDASNSTITVADSSSLQLTAATWVFFGDFSKELVVNQRLLAKRDLGGTNFDILTGSLNTIQIYDGASQTVLDADPFGRQTLIITQEAGSNKPKAYLDGVFVDEGSLNINLSAYDADVTISNLYALAHAYNNAFHSILMYSDAKTPEEVAEIHKKIITRKTPFKKKEYFATAPSVGAAESGMAENAVIVGGKTIDQGPNGYDGAIYSDIAATQPAGMTSGLTPWGEPCLLNQKGTEAHLNYGTASNTAFATSDSVFGYARWFKCSSNAAQMLMSRGGNYFFQKIGAGNLQLSMGSGAWNITSSPVRDDIWHLLSFFLDEDYEYVYVDGEQIAKNVRTGTPVTGTLREGQYTINGFDIDGGIGPRIFYKAFTDLAEYEQELKAEWNRVANKVIYKQDFSDAYEHSSTYGPGPLPGTDWNVSSVSGQVKVDADGSKYITCPSAGNVLKRHGTNHTYGRLEFECTPTSGTRARHAFAGPSQFAILDVNDSGNARIAYTTSTGGVVFATANSSIDLEKQTIRIDKKANLNTNNTTLYKDDELLTAATGSNPCTDITNFTTERQLTSYSNAKIHSITHYFGVPLD